MSQPKDHTNRRTVSNQPVVGNPALEATSISTGLRGEEKRGIIPHGGIVRAQIGDAAAAETHAKALTDSIHRGLEALENGGECVPDVEPVPGASIEVFDIFDVESGDHIAVWRVACRERAKHAN
jgi:hypothetical protein